jgi:hypothetical protein
VYRKVEASGAQSAESTHRSRLRVPGQWLGIALRSPWSPALVVLVAYGWWLVAAFHAGHDARDFIVIGRHFVQQSHSSAVIKLDPHYDYPGGGTGYDGQFAYFVALDPVHARDYLDTRSPGSAGPDYRYTRILYPMLARTLALGQVRAIPYTLLVINWLAAALGTLAVAAWLRRKRMSPWFSLLYGLYPGILVALQRDLNETLAYALVALAVYLFDRGSTPAVLGAGLAFGLASLTRETTLVFPLAYTLGAWIMRARSETRAFSQSGWDWTPLGFVALSFAPFVLWKAFLWHWLGTIGRTGGVYPQPVPFGGLLSYWPWGSDSVEQAVAIVLPAMICLGLALRGLRRYRWPPELWALLLNVLLFVVFLNRKSYVEYYASGRITAGIVLAALFCLPLLATLTRRIRGWIWVCALLWFSVLPALVPFNRRPVQWTDVPIDLGIVLVIWLLTRLSTPRVLPSSGHR